MKLSKYTKGFINTQGCSPLDTFVFLFLCNRSVLSMMEFFSSPAQKAIFTHFPNCIRALCYTVCLFVYNSLNQIISVVFKMSRWHSLSGIGSKWTLTSRYVHRLSECFNSHTLCSLSFILFNPVFYLLSCYTSLMHYKCA